MKNYLPPPVEARLERAGRFRWWIIIKVDHHTQKELVYGTRRSAQRRLEKKRYRVRHNQLEKELER